MHAKTPLELRNQMNLIVRRPTTLHMSLQSHDLFAQHILYQIKLRAAEVIEYSAFTLRKSMSGDGIPRLQINAKYEVGALNSTDPPAHAQFAQHLVRRPESPVEIRH